MKELTLLIGYKKQNTSLTISLISKEQPTSYF